MIFLRKLMAFFFYLSLNTWLLLIWKTQKTSVQISGGRLYVLACSGELAAGCFTENRKTLRGRRRRDVRRLLVVALPRHRWEMITVVNKWRDTCPAPSPRGQGHSYTAVCKGGGPALPVGPVWRTPHVAFWDRGGASNLESGRGPWAVEATPSQAERLLSRIYARGSFHSETWLEPARRAPKTTKAESWRWWESHDPGVSSSEQEKPKGTPEDRWHRTGPQACTAGTQLPCSSSSSFFSFFLLSFFLIFKEPVLSWCFHIKFVTIDLFFLLSSGWLWCF